MAARKHRHGAYSIRQKRPFVACMMFAFLHYLSILSTATFGYILYRTHDPAMGRWLAASVAGIGITWMLTHFARRAARCPLCKGTPLLDTHATKHHKAVRIRPLNYGMTAQLHLILTHRFRCMYCGTPFDLLRKPDQRRQSGPLAR